MINELTAAIIKAEAENQKAKITKQTDDFLKHILEEIEVKGNILTIKGMSCGNCFLTLKVELITEVKK